MTIAVSPDALPALVLNADYRPLSYYPLSLWNWQDAIKAICLDRVHVVSNYDRVIKSPSFEMFLPSVVSLKEYVKPARYPAFTRFNVFLRDRFQCQYCGTHEDLTFDHVVPRRCGGATTWSATTSNGSGWPTRWIPGGTNWTRTRASATCPTLRRAPMT